MKDAIREIISNNWRYFKDPITITEIGQQLASASRLTVDLGEVRVVLDQLKSDGVISEVKPGAFVPLCAKTTSGGIVMKSLLCAALCFSSLLIATAATVSDVTARQRYPWNGLVDLHFTITGDAGTKYDTSFTAKDMVGNTNIAMRTIRKADGTAAATREQLLPGTYSWVWDAVADLPKNFKCDRVTVTGTAVETHVGVQLWKDGPYWATTNIGAETPEERGYYFWWGDSVGCKREGDAWVALDGSTSNYKFEGIAITEYKSDNELKNEGWITADGVLSPEHDAACVHWGVNWRMPTHEEFDALINNCSWTWTTMNGVNGYLVRGKAAYSSNRIFLPCTGHAYWYGAYNVDLDGYYWSSVPNMDCLKFCSSYIFADNINRSNGRCIRPVQNRSE